MAEVGKVMRMIRGVMRIIRITFPCSAIDLDDQGELLNKETSRLDHQQNMCIDM